MSRHTQYKFRLYVAGDALNSAQARVNLAALCRAHLAGRYQIDIVDVYKEPKRALADAIFMTPTLVKLAPLPERTIVGTLGRTQTVLEALGLLGVST
jgi:circadian clock protein KaiB